MTRIPAVAALAIALASGCGPGGGGDDVVPCNAGLLPGDLVITEVFADATGDDDGKEWFEIYNATDSSQNLEGLVLVASKDDGTDEVTHAMTEQVIEAGGYLVLGGVLPELAPSYVDYGYGADLRVGASRGLPNTNGRLALRCDVVTVDEMTYAEVTTARSLAFDGQTSPDYTLNDDSTYWCDSATEFETGSFGTPGSANDGCASVNPSQCDDGSIRPVVPPQLGDLVISEYMARPSTDVGSANGEWLEIYVANDVDLNGLQLGRAEPVGGPQAVRTTLSSSDCLHVTAGSYVVIARNGDMTLNGGIPQVDALLGFGITDSDDGLFIGWGGEVLDAVTWVSQRPQGKAVSLDPTKLDPTANDDEAVWCNAVDAYGTGQLGTPGGPNPSCNIPPGPGQCYDNSVARAIVSPTSGQLVINEYMAHPTSPPGTSGEWIELLATADFDLNGVQLGQAEPTTGPKAVAQTLDSGQCLPVTAGTRILLARSDVADSNGGLPAVDYLLTFGITDSDDGLFVGVADAPLDVVTWTTTRPQGRSDGRDPDGTGAFCTTAAVPALAYGTTTTNYGTPGATNQCN